MPPYINETTSEPVVPRITVRTLRAQRDGAEIAVGITIERGEQSESVLLPLSTDAYCELKPQKGEITEEQLKNGVLIKRGKKSFNKFILA